MIGPALAVASVPLVPAQTSDPVIGGGTGRGRATNVGQLPEDVAVHGDRVYVSDPSVDVCG